MSTFRTFLHILTILDFLHFPHTFSHQSLGESGDSGHHLTSSKRAEMVQNSKKRSIKQGEMAPLFASDLPKKQGEGAPLFASLRRGEQGSMRHIVPQPQGEQGVVYSGVYPEWCIAGVYSGWCIVGCTQGGMPPYVQGGMPPMYTLVVCLPMYTLVGTPPIPPWVHLHPAHVPAGYPS